MIKLLQEFLIVFIIVFCINMIYFYFRNKSKKYGKTPTVEMVLLIRMFDINLSMIGIKTVQRHIALINSLIMTLDLLLLYHIKSIILSIILIGVSTFILIGVLYYILGSYYKKLIFRR